MAVTTKRNMLKTIDDYVRQVIEYTPKASQNDALWISYHRLMALGMEEGAVIRMVACAALAIRLGNEASGENDMEWANRLYKSLPEYSPESELMKMCT